VSQSLLEQFPALEAVTQSFFQGCDFAWLHTKPMNLSAEF